MSTIPEQLAENQAVQFDENMALHTLVGNITHWRLMKNNKRRQQIITGRMKILSLLARAK